MPRRKLGTVEQVAATGEQLATLRTIRQELARKMDDCNDEYALVQLASQIRATLADIRELESKADDDDGKPNDDPRSRIASAVSGANVVEDEDTGEPILLWAARDFLVDVCRQNGKNVWIEPAQFVGLAEFGDRLYTHTAHRDETSGEHFVSLTERIEASDFLQSYMPQRGNRGLFTANGKQSVQLANGHRLNFRSRLKGAGRGPSPQKLFFDEALVLMLSQIGSYAPSTSAQKNPQFVFLSSAPLEDSEALFDLERRAALPPDHEDRGRLFAAIWHNDQTVATEDEEAIRRVNPSLGFGRLTVRSVQDNRRIMEEADYRREHLGVPDEPVGDQKGPIDREAWDNLCKMGEAVEDRAVALAVSVDRKWATIGATGKRADGSIHVEWKARKPGLSWVVKEAKKITKAGLKLRARKPGLSWVVKEAKKITKAGLKLRVWNEGPEGSLIPRLKKAEVDLEIVSSNEVSQLTGTLIDLVQEGGIQHLGQKTLSDQAEIGRLRMGAHGALIWSAKNSDSAIDALVAITVALGGTLEPEPEDDDDWFVE
eukprot:g16097.t1